MIPSVPAVASEADEEEGTSDEGDGQQEKVGLRLVLVVGEADVVVVVVSHAEGHKLSFCAWLVGWKVKKGKAPSKSKEDAECGDAPIDEAMRPRCNYMPRSLYEAHAGSAHRHVCMYVRLWVGQNA